MRIYTFMSGHYCVGRIHVMDGLTVTGGTGNTVRIIHSGLALKGPFHFYIIRNVLEPVPDSVGELMSIFHVFG